MPAPRKKRKKLNYNFDELPLHIKRAELGNHNWRTQCKRREYPVKVHPNLTLSELEPMRFILIRNAKELWENCFTMLLEMSMDSAYVEPVYARTSALLQVKSWITAADLYLAIMSLLEMDKNLLEERTIHYEPEFNPGDLYPRNARRNFTS